MWLSQQRSRWLSQQMHGVLKRHCPHSYLYIPSVVLQRRAFCLKNIPRCCSGRVLFSRVFLSNKVLLFFFFQPIHVPWLSTLRDSFWWDLSTDHFDLRHWLNIYLLIHVGLVVEHVLRSGHRLRLLNCYFRGLLLAHRLLLKGWRWATLVFGSLVGPDIDLWWDYLRRWWVLKLASWWMPVHSRLWCRCNGELRRGYDQRLLWVN